MASPIDLNSIKTAIKNIMDANNTNTAAPVGDLSAHLTKRVAKVLKVHPSFIPIQPSYYPCVTMYIDEKTLRGEDIAGSQLNAKRNSDIFIEVVGAVWNSNLKVNTEDPADEDINHLMENIEFILRGNSTLNGTVKWILPTGTKYYASQVEEQTHLRVGILRLRATVFN